MRFLNFNASTYQHGYSPVGYLNLGARSATSDFHRHLTFVKMTKQDGQRVELTTPQQFAENRWILGTDANTIVYCDKDVSKIDVNKDFYLLKTGYYQSTGKGKLPNFLDDCYLLMNEEDFRNIKVIASGEVMPSLVIEDKCCSDAILVVPKTVKYCQIKPEGVFIYDHTGKPIERREWHRVKPTHLYEIFEHKQRRFYPAIEIITNNNGVQVFKPYHPDKVRFYNHEIVTGMRK